MLLDLGHRLLPVSKIVAVEKDQNGWHVRTKHSSYPISETKLKNLRAAVGVTVPAAPGFKVLQCVGNNVRPSDVVAWAIAPGGSPLPITLHDNFAGGLPDGAFIQSPSGAVTDSAGASWENYDEWFASISEVAA